MKSPLFVLILSLLSLDVIARPAEPYNPDHAVQYAQQWAKSRNPDYKDFSANSSDGGDCTNFASQVVRAGGWRNTATGKPTSDTQWYYVSRTNYSQTWSVANAFFRHASFYEGWTKWNGATSVNYGDIVAVDWRNDGFIDHNMVVTGFRRTPDGLLEPVFSYHSSDQKNIPLSALMERLNRTLGQNAVKNVKFYRLGLLNQCVAPKASQIISN